jgi:hypothetical protein
MIKTIVSPTGIYKVQILDGGQNRCRYELWIKTADGYRPFLRDERHYSLEKATLLAERLLREAEELCLKDEAETKKKQKTRPDKKRT